LTHPRADELPHRRFVPDDLPRFAPVRLTLASPDEGWHGVSIRGWSLPAASEPTAPIPPLATFAVVAYQRGSSPMHRLQDGHWKNDTVGPGDMTIMNAGIEATWRWLAPLDDTHVYLTKDLMTATWREMYQQDVTDVGLRDAIKVRDRAIFRAAMLIAAEAEHGLAGSRILVDSLRRRCACGYCALTVMRY